MILQEGFVSAYKYVPPEDPEKLLYDFYFFVGYVNPSLFPKEEEQFALNEAVSDCVTHLQKHMIAALKYALSAELRYYEKSSVIGPHTAEEIEKMPSMQKKFLFTYSKELSYRATASDVAKFDPREVRNIKKIKRNPFLKKEQDNYSARTSYYLTSYKAVEATQKKLDLSDLQLADIFFYLFDVVSWKLSFGGKAWAKIAKAYKNLLLSKTLQEKIVWVDHAYDLQHNTDTVFNKLQVYYKYGGYRWIAEALDWKKDQTDLRSFYSKVSSSVRPLVGFISYRKGVDLQNVKDDTFSTNSFVIGDYVKVKATTDYPTYGWGGGVTYSSVGKVVQIESKDKIYIDFPGHKGWAANPAEIEKATEASHFAVGDHVKLKSGQGWCKEAPPNSVGVIVNFVSSNLVAVSFSACSQYWIGSIKEIKKVRKN